MQMLYKNCNIKRKISWLLAFITFFMFFISSFSIDVMADDASTANSLQQNYINLMGGSKITDINAVSNIQTIDDLRNLALFLSNAYVPFYTSLDGSSEETNKKNMIDMLKLIGFDEEAATEMANMTYAATLDSATKLYIKKSDMPELYYNKDDSTGHRLGLGTTKGTCVDFLVGNTCFSDSVYQKCVGDEYNYEGGEYTPFTLFEFQGLMDTYISNWKIANYESTGGVPLYAKIDGEWVNCFTLSASTMAILVQVINDSNSEDVAKGKLCNSIFNATASEMADISTEEGIAPNTMFCQNIYVDWVGNVLIDRGDERIILVPAYLNYEVFTELNGTNERNLLGVLPIKYFSNADTKSFDKDDSSKSYFAYYANGKTIEVKLVQSRGSSAKVQFDDEDGWGGGTALDCYRKIVRDTHGASGEAKGHIVISGEDLDDPLISDYQEFRQHIDYSDYSKKWSESNTFYNFMVYKEVKQTKDTSNSEFEVASLFGSDSFFNYFGSKEKFKSSDSVDYMIGFTSSDKKMLQNIFLTYTFAYCNKNETSFSEDKYINMKFNDVFPKVSDDIDWNILSVDSTADEVLSFVYYLLHPSEGIAYVATWLKNKLSGIFVGWHEDIVGSTDSNSTTGMTHYLGFSGYVTTPSLYDIEWVANILNSYNSIIVYILIIMAVILLAYIIIGTMTVQRAILGFLMFAILAFLPPVAINTTMNVVNTTSDKIYSSKFDYWALCQIEQYITQLSEVETADTGADYVKQLLEMNKISNSNTSIAGSSENSYSGVKLKWLSPKRFNELNAFSDEVQNRIDSSNSGLSSWTTNLLVNSEANASGTEMYLRSDSVGYLYRDILDIYKYSSISYHAFKDFGIADNNSVDKWFTASNTNYYKIKTLSGQDFYKYVQSNWEGSTNYNTISNDIKETSSLNAIRKGFLVDTIGIQSGNNNYYNPQGGKSTNAVSLFLKYNLCDVVHKSLTNLDKYVGDNSKNNSLNITVSNFHFDAMNDNAIIFGITPDKFNLSVNDIITYDATKTSSVSKCSPANLSGFYYALYSESPFYYFNYNIRDQINVLCSGYNYNYSDLTNSSKHIKNMFLDNNQSYFFNLATNAGDGYGELRDFMNMHDLFYYIIPALQDGNNLVNTFNDVFGLTLYDDMPIKINEAGDLTYDGTTLNLKSQEFASLFSSFSVEQKHKFWHNYNVRTVYNCYSSWLNLMSACDYADEENITIAGNKFKVENPLDPTSYYKMDSSGKITAGRLMIFSRSEMKYYGLGLDDLTTVERKIIEIQDNVYKDTLELMNYYTLSDETIIQGYSMIQLFNFNKVFSQESLISEDVILYPQSYELKAFTYDAYLRLIINGSSNEDLMTSGAGDGNTSIYQRVLEKTSIFFGIVLIANDFIAVYVIPALKLFFLIIIFFLSILIIISSAIKMEMNLLNVVWKSLLAPLLSFGAVSIGLSWLVSKFMSEGAQGVTKTDTVISLGDPTMVILVMLIINIVVLILYWKICKKCFKDFKKFVTAVFNDALGAVSGALGKVVGTVTAGKIQGRAAGKAMGYSTAKQRGADNKPTSGKSGLGFGKGLATGAGLGVGAKVGSELAEGATSGSNRYDDKTALGRAMNDKVNKADSNIARAEEAKDASMSYKDSKDDKFLDKTVKKQDRLNDKSKKANEKLSEAKKNAYKNRDKSSPNSVLGVNDSKSVKKAKAKADKAKRKLDKFNGKTDKRLEKAIKKTDKVKNKADKRISKAKAKSSGLKANGLNRYKLGAVAGIAGKATAKAIGTGAKATAKVGAKAVKGTAKVGTKALKNTARVTGSVAKTGAMATAATVSALGNSLSS